MDATTLAGKRVLVTGGARRVGRIFALACARAGADVLIHYGHSEQAALDVKSEIEALGRRAEIFAADFSDAEGAAPLIERAAASGALYGLVNSAAIFESLGWETADAEAWERHLAINLTAPFLLSQAFARQVPAGGEGRIVNILDWRALHPGPDHLPYTVSKAALAALTESLARALAPRIVVNGLALGAILPPSEGAMPAHILDRVPAGRWADQSEVEQALVFLLSGPSYIVGEIIHVDGGRHLA
jgi:NAD(P)-dependent dehydrogenase (short-subunit alcohol dehydrogenase family)